MASLHRPTTVALAVGLALGAVLGLATAAAAQEELPEVCVEFTNDADGNGSFSDDETASEAGDVTHRVSIDNCGNWDVTMGVVAARLLGGEMTVCDDLVGQELLVDDVSTCEFEVPTTGTGGTTEVVVAVARSGEPEMTAEASDDTSFTLDAESAPQPSESESEPDETDGELAQTGVPVHLGVFGLALTLFGLLLVDAGRRGHIVIQTCRDVERNPLLLTTRTITRHHRWLRDDLRRWRR